MAKKALIFGITGQDGAYLARFLLSHGYAVAGTSRSTSTVTPPNLVKLGLLQKVALHRVDPTNLLDVELAIQKSRPREVYYLAAQSSVARSFSEPAASLSQAIGLVNVLDAVRRQSDEVRVLNAASGDCFGISSEPITELTRFAPRSPYALAKCAAHHAVAISRLAYDQFACSAFLFTHESPLRSEAFAIAKAVATARRIAAGSGERLIMGNVEVVRDWGWAPDYVVAMWKMLQLDKPEDFVIATGQSHRLGTLLRAIFCEFGLDWNDHVDIDRYPQRATDIAVQYADPTMARDRLGWTATGDLMQLVAQLTQDSGDLSSL